MIIILLIGSIMIDIAMVLSMLIWASNLWEAIVDAFREEFNPKRRGRFDPWIFVQMIFLWAMWVFVWLFVIAIMAMPWVL